METVREDAECPSLSPNGRRLAYKKLGDRGPGAWRLAVLDLETGIETHAGPSRGRSTTRSNGSTTTKCFTPSPLSGLIESSVDRHLRRYPADGTGAPALFIPAAASPAVVR